MAELQNRLRDINTYSQTELNIKKNKIELGEKMDSSQILKMIEELKKLKDKPNELLNKFKDIVDKTSDDILDRFSTSDYVLRVYNAFGDFLNNIKSDNLGYLFNSLIYI